MKFTVLLFLLLMVFSLNAQVAIMYDTGEITATDSYTTSNDYYGNCVDIDGDYAIIGAMYNKDGGSNEKGAAYIYHWDGSAWVQQEKLTAFDATYGDWFGRSVAINGVYAIVGAPGCDLNGHSNSGAAYIYKRTGTSWNYYDRAFPNHSGCSDYSDFGVSVDINGDYAIVGAPQADITGDDDKGAAYIFHRVGSIWDEQIKLTDTNAYNLGNDVAIWGNYALVACNNKGYVYSFYQNGGIWSQTQKFQASSLDQYDVFGSSVSLNGTYAIVGGTAYNYGEGAAYVFTRSGNTYSDQATLHPSTPTGECSFGLNVELSGDKAIVGQYTNSDLGDYAGSAYIFKRTGTSWSQSQQLFGANIDEYDNYGSGVSISGDKAIVGAPNAYGDDPSSGTAYGYSLDGVTSASSIPVNNQTPNNLPSVNTNFQFTGNHAATEMTVTMFGFQAGITGSLPTGINELAPNRYWQVISSEGNVGTYDITFDLTGVTGITDFNTVKFVKRHQSGDAWQDVTQAPINATVTRNYPYITISGLTGFSDFAPAGDFDDPLSVELTGFFAIQTNSNLAELNWITQSETNMNGYNIYRNTEDDIDGVLQLNSVIISAANSSQSHEYSFLDSDAELYTTYYYWLESVELDGSSAWHGPVSITLTAEGNGGEDVPDVVYQTGINSIFPNPFNSRVNISYYLEEESDVIIEIYNAKGQKVYRIADGKKLPKVLHTVRWNGKTFGANKAADGTYFFKFIAGKTTEIKKGILMK